MRRFLLTCSLAIAMAMGATAQTRQIHIVSGNDMHAAIDNMPKLSAIVDSLRKTDNNLLVFSAGDNRTGNPINDLYSLPTYPMTALMNFIGFDGSAFGNHEFDNGQAGLPKVMASSNFPYLCANVHAAPEMGINPLPYKIYDVGGVTVGVIGVVQLGPHGYPDAHPDLLKGIQFTEVEKAIGEYLWLRDKVNVLILLSHLGYEDDVVMAEKFPCFDLIIGGHSHTQLKGGEMHNGVLVTQNTNKLKRITYTTLDVKDGKVTAKRAENIEVEKYPAKNVVAQTMVDFFNNNPEFKRQLAVATTDFTNAEELGSLMCDALISDSGADFALQNCGGVRYDEKKAGPITVDDVLRLDPFGNSCIEMTLTGKEFKDMLISCYDNSENAFPYVGGMTCELVFNKKDPSKLDDVRVFTLDGKKLNLKKKYKVVTNSYVAAICDSPRADEGHDIGKICSDMLMTYLEKQKTVDYKGVKRIKK